MIDPAPATTFAHLDATTVPSRGLASKGNDTLKKRKKGDGVIAKRKYNSDKSDVKWSRKGVVAMGFEGINIPFM